MKYTGVTARGIRTPIFRQGDDLVSLACDSILQASANEGFALSDGDIVGVTEAVVARVQGNYATCDQIASAIRARFPEGELGLVFPILSRNRFSVLLRGIAMGVSKLFVQLSFPSDEVGNALFDPELVYEKDVNPHTETFDEAGLRAVVGGQTVHPFTGVDYIDFYKSISDNIELVFANDPRHILTKTPYVLACDIHSRFGTRRLLAKAGAKRVLTLDDILRESVDGSGWSEYGLLGSNKAGEDRVKLFPHETVPFVKALQTRLKEKTGKTLEVLVYGDGGFKDPKGFIWELADPVISPAFTEGLQGTPNELKLKYIADNELGHLSGPALEEAIRAKIAAKKGSLVGDMTAEGTTPRHLSDLVGSLCDLVSGSGDRGTPVVLVQGYFNSLAND